MRRIWALAAAAVCTLFTFSELAQAGSAVIGGKRLSCSGTRVKIDCRGPGAMMMPGLIVINPRELDDLPVVARQFAFLHECGHQFIGDSEIAADCWAVREGKITGLLNRDSFETVCRAIAEFPGGREHPPGRVRCREMRRCYARAPGPAMPPPPVPTEVAEASAIKTPAPRIVVSLTPAEAGALWDLIRNSPKIALSTSVLEGLKAAARLRPPLRLRPRDGEPTLEVGGISKPHSQP